MVQVEIANLAVRKQQLEWIIREAAKAKEGACGANMKGCGEGMQGCTEMQKSKDGSCGANMKPAVPAAAPAAPVPAAPK